jgi:hypothetical protein
MTVLAPVNGVLDDFNRPDEDPLSDGGRWITPTPNTGGSLQVISDQCAGRSATGGSEMYWHQQRWKANMEVFCTLAVKPLANEWFFLNLRINNNDTASAFVSSYFLLMTALSGTDKIEIYREQPGGGGTAVTTQLAIVSQEFAAGDRFWFTAIDNVLTGYRDDGTGFAQVLTVTDTAFNNDGFISVQIKNATCRIDDFGGGSIPVGPSQIYRTLSPN